jgi:hypothetical protein
MDHPQLVDGVEIDGGDGTRKILLVEPTGHMRFTFDMLHPKKHG